LRARVQPDRAEHPLAQFAVGRGGRGKEAKYRAP
jgi:hypothetical protein